MIMPSEFYPFLLLCIIFFIAFSTFFAARIIGLSEYSKSEFKVFQVYFVFGLLGWIFYGIVDIISFPIPLSLLAIAYFFSVYILFFIVSEDFKY